MRFHLVNNLSESKQDMDLFIKKFGQDRWSKYQAVKNKIPNELYTSKTTGEVIQNPKNINEITKYMDEKSLDELIDFYNNRKTRASIKQSGQELILKCKNGDRLYRITTPEAMQLIGENTTWCIAGKYPGHEEEQLKWWDEYIEDTDGGFYVIVTHDGEKYCAVFDGQKIEGIYNAIDSIGEGNDNIINEFTTIPMAGKEIYEYLKIEYPNMSEREIRWAKEIEKQFYEIFGVRGIIYFLNTSSSEELSEITISARTSEHISIMQYENFNYMVDSIFGDDVYRMEAESLGHGFGKCNFFCRAKLTEEDEPYLVYETVAPFVYYKNETENDMIVNVRNQMQQLVIKHRLNRHDLLEIITYED